MKNKSLRKQIAIGCTALALGAVAVGGTMAYFTDNENVTNEFTLGYLDVELTEPNWDPTTDGDNEKPGSTEDKDPTVTNVTSNKNGEEPGYVRMILQVQDSTGKAITDAKALALIDQTIRYDAAAGTATEHFKKGDIPGHSLDDMKAYPKVNPQFVLDDTRSDAANGKYVYNYMGADGKGILKIGQKATLFTDVVFPTDWNQTQIEDMGDFQLAIKVEAVQASNFANQAAAYNALDAEIAGKTLQHITNGTAVRP